MGADWSMDRRRSIESLRCGRKGQRLAQVGWCLGRKGQTDVKKECHACQPDSIYEHDVEAVQP